jgi:transposase, IS5 family
VRASAIYRTLVETTTKTVRQAQRVRGVLREAGEQADAARQRLAEQLDQFIPLVRQAISQARRRVLQGEQVPASEKVVSLFEPHTRIIPRHKGGAAVEFGRMVVFDEVEGGIVTRFAILEDKTAEHGQLAPALVHHQQVFGHPPRLVTGDWGTPPTTNGSHGKRASPTWSFPCGTAQSCPTGARTRAGLATAVSLAAGMEGRISSLRRDYGLRHCPSHGEDGMLRHIGWGVLASNLRHIGQHLAAT